MTTTCTMILGDCLEVMQSITAGKATLMFADLPYSITSLKWDKEINLDRFWPSVEKSVAQDARLIFSSVQPFTSKLVMHKPRLFRHELIWRKGQATNFLQAKRQPLRIHESILIFGGTTYNPIMWQHTQERHGCGKRLPSGSSVSTYGRQRSNGRTSTTRFPLSLLDIRARENKLHPTQKPLALLDWIVRTYSNAGDMILDPTAGSGTTAVSACQNGRNVTCIEKDEGYFEASVERVRKHIRDNLLDVNLEVRK